MTHLYSDDLAFETPLFEVRHAKASVSISNTKLFSVTTEHKLKEEYIVP